MSLHFSVNYSNVKNENRVLLLNTLSGASVMVSDECFRILEMAVEKGISADYLIEIADSEDQEYLKSLLGLLVEQNIMIDSDVAEQETIESVSVEITHRCNLNCKHCSANAHTMNEPEYFKTEDLKDILDKIMSVNPENICVTGGEPMVRNDFREITEHMAENYSGILSIMTNGTLVNKKNIDWLTSCYKVWDISLDGINEETCASIRGKGVFKRVLDSIHLLQSKGIEKISLSMVVTSATQDYVHEFMKMCEHMNVYPIIREYEEQGRGKENAQELRPTQQVIDQKELLSIAKEIGESNRERPLCFTCGAAKREFFVNYQGDLYPCAPLQYPEFHIGNVLKINSFKDYILNHKYMDSSGFLNMQKYNPSNFQFCKDCPNSMFCWSCILDIYLNSKNIESFHQRCKLKKEEYKYIWNI